MKEGSSFECCHHGVNCECFDLFRLAKNFHIYLFIHEDIYTVESEEIKF